MFIIEINDQGEIQLSGRLDASQAEKARQFLQNINNSRVVDFKDLDYISSAGLGVLLATQKRLNENGQSLKLINLNNHIRDIFRYAGFDTIFEID